MNLNLAAIPIPPKFRRPLMVAGYAAFALLTVLITVFASLPRDRIKDRVEQTLSADPMSGAPGAIGMDVTIGELGLTLFTGAGLRAKDLVLRSRPLDLTNVKPTRFLIDDVTVKVGLLGLWFNRPTYRFTAHGLQGEVTGKISTSPAEQGVRIEANNLLLTGVTAIRDALTLPVEGTLSGKLDAVAAKNLSANLDGTLEVAIEDAVLGDGKAKLTVPGDPFLAQGITFPRLRFGRLGGQVVMEKGRASLEGWHVKSDDGEATLEGYVELRDPLGMSQVHGYLKFKPSDALLKREPTVELMNNALAAAKRPDGFIGFQLTGPLSAIFFNPNPNPPSGVGSRAAPPSAPQAPPVAFPAHPSLNMPQQVPPPPTMVAPPPTPSEPTTEQPSLPPPPVPGPERPPPPPGGPIGAPSGVRPSIRELHPQPAEDQPASPLGEPQ